MNERLSCVMLIDDDEDDNFFHKLVLEKAGLADTIEIAESGIEALDMLGGQNIKPDLIFLDLNMPRLNGFEFVEELNKSGINVKPVIVLLTTSLHSINENNSILNKIHGLETKPLTLEKLKPIALAHFGINL